MDESATTAITAIADVRLEGSITASLHRLGWSVLYRATSIEGLQRAISEHPQALIVASDDFRGFSEVKISRQIKLHSASAPGSDLALHELIRNLEEPKNVQPRTLKLSYSKICLVASSGRTVGTSTIALNLADELSRGGASTLLLDCNPWNPYLSRHLGINGISREISRTSHGFSVGEIVTSKSLSALAPSLDSFEYIVIDYGQLREPAKVVSGRRVHEEVFTWAMHSNSTIFLLSRSDDRAIEDLHHLKSELENAFPNSRKELLLTLSQVLSRRERTRLIANFTTHLGSKPRLISREHRYIAEMEDKGSTLAEIAPKSLVLSELRELIENLR